MPTRTRAAVLAGGLLALTLPATLGTAPAVASEPGESTIVGPKKPGLASSEWAGTITNPGADLAPELGAVDTHELTVVAPGKGAKAAKYFTKNAATLQVIVSWTGVYNDLDLRIFDEDGTELAVDGAFATESETVSIPVDGPGTYTVEVTSYLAEPGIAYDAVATLAVTR